MGSLNGAIYLNNMPGMHPKFMTQLHRGNVSLLAREHDYFDLRVWKHVNKCLVLWSTGRWWVVRCQHYQLIVYLRITLCTKWVTLSANLGQAGWSFTENVRKTREYWCYNKCNVCGTNVFNETKGAADKSDEKPADWPVDRPENRPTETKRCKD